MAKKEEVIREKEKAIREKVEATREKIEAIWVNEITRENLEKTTKQVVSLTAEKERLTRIEITLKDSNAELSNKISVPENDLALSRWSDAKKKCWNCLIVQLSHN